MFGLSDHGARAMKRMLALLLAGLVVSSGALAQDSRPGDRKPSGRQAGRKPGDAGQSSESNRDRLSRRFNEASPKLGELLPDVAGYTADGKPLKLRSLKGDYKVLVFGCLT